MTDSSTFIAALASQNLPNINCHIRVSDELLGIEKSVKTFHIFPMKTDFPMESGKNITGIVGGALA